MKLCVHVSVYFCSWSGGGISILANPFMDTLVERIQVGCHPVPSGVLDDLCCLRSLAAASRWAKVDTLPLLRGGYYHVTEVVGLNGL
jgi:hypothetical protein